MNDPAAEELRRQMAEINEMSNPANDLAAERTGRPERVPMSAVRQRLQVKPIPGFRMYWFKEENVPAAIDAYYEPVKRHEISTNAVNIGSDSQASGNTDMGTNVSLVAGQGSGGQPIRLVLMKIKQEYFLEDQKAIVQRNSKILQAIFGDEAIVGEDGMIRQIDAHTYIKPQKQPLFNRPVRKAKLAVRGR